MTSIDTMYNPLIQCNISNPLNQLRGGQRIMAKIEQEILSYTNIASGLKIEITNLLKIPNYRVPSNISNYFYLILHLENYIYHHGRYK